MFFVFHFFLFNKNYHFGKMKGLWHRNIQLGMRKAGLAKVYSQIFSKKCPCALLAFIELHTRLGNSRRLKSGTENESSRGFMEEPVLHFSAFCLPSDGIVHFQSCSSLCMEFHAQAHFTIRLKRRVTMNPFFTLGRWSGRSDPKLKVFIISIGYLSTPVHYLLRFPRS